MAAKKKATKKNGKGVKHYGFVSVAMTAVQKRELKKRAKMYYNGNVSRLIRSVMGL